jgi:hypothetical protein
LSVSREPPGRIGHSALTATSQPGVEIEVIDANFRPVAKGVTELTVRLPEGVYTVRFAAAGRSEQRFVRLRSGVPAEVHGADFPLESAPPSEATGASDLERRQARAVSRLVKPDRKASHNSEIVVFVRAPDDRTRSDVSRSLRLFHPDGGDAGLGELTGEDADQNKSEGWGTRLYVLRPGAYRLRFESSARRMAEQTLCVFPGRRTYAFLQYGSSLQVVQAADGSFRAERKRGMEAALATFVSTPLGELEPSADDVRLADILLHAIRVLSTAIDPATVERFGAQDACPYLRLYTCAALIRRLEAIRETRPAQMAAVTEAPIPAERLEAWIEGLLSAPLPPGDWPDFEIMGWRLAMLRDPPEEPQYAFRLRSPPMLDCCWRWASAYSVDHPDRLPVGGVFEAAATARLPAGPWLVWRSSATHGDAPEGSPEPTELQRSLEQLARELTSTRSGRPGAASYPFQPTRQFLADLTQRSQALAAAVMGFEARDDVTTSAGLRQIALALGTPAQTLERQVTEAIEEVQGLKEQFE